MREDLIKDMFAKIKKERWTCRGAFHLSSQTTLRKDHQARYWRSSAPDNILAMKETLRLAWSMFNSTLRKDSNKSTEKERPWS